jgi:hypothetical protein
MCAGGSHYSRTFECDDCGYSRFHYAHEFADGKADDKRRICADCGCEHDERNTVERMSYGTVGSL